MTTITAQALNQDVSAAKRAAENGPVIVTTRGRPTHVVLAYRDFEALAGAATGPSTSLFDVLHPAWLDDHDDDIDLMDAIGPRTVDDREVDLT